MNDSTGLSLTQLLAQERRARLAAERRLDQKQRELVAANRQLAEHARSLSDEIIVHREQALTILSKAEVLEGENTQARDDLERANQNALVAERRLWEALETIHDGFAVFNSENRMVMANRAYMALFDGIEAVQPGISYAEIVDITLDEGLVDIGEETAEVWRERIVARWNAAQIEPEVIKLYSGDYVKMIDRRARDGDLVSLALNITETINYEEQLKEERGRAETASRAKSAFLANMSHEIRTPMNGVVGMADLLAETELSEEQRLFADTIRSSGEALLVIINDVLDYSKIEAQKLTLAPEVFDLERAIHEVMILLKPKADAKNLDMIVDYDIFLPTRFIADPGRMRQVLTNLLGNAVKFTASGHVLVRVTGMPDSEESGPGMCLVHLTIEDTGIGIPPDKIDHIFGQFNQVEDAKNRKFEGTGLGLAITRQLILLMGGDIWVDSVVEEGSSFGLRLEVPIAEPRDPLAKGPPGRLRRALVVDDQQINRVILERQLTTMGLEVTVCRNAAEVLEHPIGQYDVILTDHEMPGLDGVELATRLRAMGDTTPIVLLTSAAGEIKAGPGKPITGILQKPLLRRALFARLNELGTVPEAQGDAQHQQAQLERAEPPATPPARRPAGLRAMRVLSAEDNRTNRLVFGKMVQHLELDLTYAEDGAKAVEAFSASRPDLIFMDISMPGMDGREAAIRIRKLEAASGAAPVPICALTAHAMSGDEVEILAAGIDHCLTKPLRKAEICALIDRYRPQDAPPDDQAKNA